MRPTLAVCGLFSLNAARFTPQFNRAKRSRCGAKPGFQNSENPVSQSILHALSPPAVILQDDIPVLWLLNNEDVNPPWGKVARITI